MQLTEDILDVTKIESGSLILKKVKFDKKIVIKIRDTGIGIHLDVLPKLFTKFATKSDTSGTELGLFIQEYN
jgi:C4-dicarboxylate-specific signal transduction histidine kinase